MGLPGTTNLAIIYDITLPEASTQPKHISAMIFTAARLIRPRKLAHRTNDHLISFIKTSDRRWAQNIFCAHPAAYIWDSAQTDESHKIANIFYNKCYTPPKLFQGSTYDNPTVPLEQFVNEITEQPTSNSRNTLHYLVGKVGVGKTAFVNYLISEKGKSLFDEKNMWFLRVDVERSHALKDGLVVTDSDILIKIVRKLVKVTARFPQIYNNLNTINAQLTQLTDLVQEYDTTHNDKLYGQIELSFCACVTAITHHTKRRLLLILDNLDYIAHINDRGLYRNEQRTKDEEYISGVLKFITLFTPEASILSQLNASIIFVMRNDTFDILRLPHGVSDMMMPDADTTNCYTLDQTTWFQVYKSRVALLDLAQKYLRIPGAIQDLNRVAERMQSGFNAKKRYRRDDGTVDERSVINTLIELSNYGYRGLVEYLGTYAFLSEAIQEQSIDPLTVISTQHASAVITFLLRDNLYFGQDRCCFPNIYLSDIGDGPNGNHRPSYWLKRLILEFIDKYDGKVTAELLLDIFADNGSPEFYDRELVVEALGSLSDANVSNMLFVKRSRTANRREIIIDEIFLNGRAKVCLSSIFDSFAYLQLIVDEELLPLPLSIHSFFRFDPKQPRYSYLLNSDLSKYRRDAASMVKHKARLVSLFMIVLEEALRCERELYHGSFKNLAKYIGRLHTGYIWTDMIEDIQRIGAHFHADVNEDLAISKELMLSIRSDLRTAFSLRT